MPSRRDGQRRHSSAAAPLVLAQQQLLPIDLRSARGASHCRSVDLSCDTRSFLATLHCSNRYREAYRNVSRHGWVVGQIASSTQSVFAVEFHWFIVLGEKSKREVFSASR